MPNIIEATKYRLAIANEFGVYLGCVQLVGSTQIVGKGADVDLLVLFDPKKFSSEQAEDFLRSKKFVECSEDYEGVTPLKAWRRGKVNVLAVYDSQIFATEALFAYAAKTTHKLQQSHGARFTMKDKDVRVEFHAEMREYRALIEADLFELNF